MPLDNLYRELRIPQYSGTWGWSGRNEATNTVVFQIDSAKFREPTVLEKMSGIAIVHEFTARDIESWRRTCREMKQRAPEHQTGWNLMREDLAFACDQESCVRGAVFDSTHVGEEDGAWRLLPNLGQVVEFDRDTWTYRIVFFE